MHSIIDNDKLLIQIFTGVVDRVYIEKLLKVMRMLLPSAHIIGTSTDGEICSGKVSTRKTVISLTQFETTQLKTTLIEDADNCYETGQKIVNELSSESTKVIISFLEGLHRNGEAYLQGIHAIDESLIVAGGMAGDNAQFDTTYLFTREKISSNGAVAVALINPDLYVYTDYSFNWLSIGKIMKITKVDTNRVYTIDDMPACMVYEKYLGEDVGKLLPSVGVEFPLIMQRGEKDVARAIMKKHDDGSLSFSGNIEVGERVTFGYGDAEMILGHSIETQKNLIGSPIESIFIYSCMARRRFMPELIESETIPFQDLAEVSGFFTYGEFFSTSSQKELFSQSMTLLGLSESPKESKDFTTKREVPVALSEYQKSIKALTHLLSMTTRELAEENSALAESREILSDAKESFNQAQRISHIGSWEIDLASRVSQWSDENYHIFGVNLESREFSFELFVSMTVEDDRSKILKIMDSLGDGDTKSVSVRVERTDGEIIHVMITVKILLDKEKNPLKIVGTTQDMTTTLAIARKERQQAQILEQIHDSVISTNLDDRIIHWNNGACTMHGYSEQEMLGESIRLLYPPEELEKFQKIKEHTLAVGSYQGQIRKVTKNGDIIDTDVSLSLLRGDSGEIIGLTRYSQDITQKKLIESKFTDQTRELNSLAYYDKLTKLPNRVHFDDRLQEAIVQAHKSNKEFALLFIDLDNFKQINDTLGHHYGDDVLRIVAKRFLDCVDSKDILARLGGDEFTVLIYGIRDHRAVAEIAQKIIDALKPVVTLENHELYISASMGISLYPHDSVFKSDLLKYADIAMYHAKNKGRDNYQFYSREMTKLAFEKARMEKYLYDAIKKKQLVVYYQPQIDTRDNSIIGMEALVRWNHPDLGIITPDNFIPLAEEIGLISELDNFVMYQAMRDVQCWHDEGIDPGVLSLNLSAIQLKSESFIERLKQMIVDTRFDVKFLELEVTESQMMEDPAKSIEILWMVREMGIKIAIDDFGTGFSSLAYLKKLPVNKLKIDRSFTKEIPYNDNDCTLSKTVISLASSFGLTIIAEGVERKEQIDYLVSNGCFYMQGFYYSKAITKENMRNFITNNKTTDPQLQDKIAYRDM